MRAQLVRRARILSIVFIAAALLLTMRLYFVQVVNGDEYARDAMGQYVEIAPDTEARHGIYFTTKDGAPYAAAVMQSGWRIAINPKDIEDPASLFAALSAFTSIDRERFMLSAAKKSDPYEEVAFRVSDSAAAQIRTKKLRGVILVQDQWRNYPGQMLAAQVIGFTGYRGEAPSRVGVYGIERQWEETLAETSTGLYVNPFAEIFTNMQAALGSAEKQHGDIITSIEPSVQAQLEKTLDEFVQTFSPRLAGGIIMDPKTGRIVAMANRPAFDPNTYNTVTNTAVFSNPLVEGRYELGSIMKPLTVAAGIDAGVITPATKYKDDGCIERSGRTICNFDHKARGVVPVQEVLNQSLNVGATWVADKMGHPVLTDYMKAFGFGERTGIDLPSEVQGNIAQLGDGRGPEVNYAAASFGQGISVSPIEMIRALAALANEGVLPNPHVVEAIRLESGITRTIAATSGRQVLKPETAQTVSTMLTEVFDKSLLKGKLKQEHYSIAAKTGTAQIAQPGGGYYTDRYLHSFFGYFPAHQPKFIVLLFAVEPHGVEYASASLAHPFLDIAKFLINYYDIAPDR